MRNHNNRRRRDERIRRHVEKLRRTWRYAALPTPRQPVANGVASGNVPPVVTVPPPPRTSAEVLARAAMVTDELNALVDLYLTRGLAPVTRGLRKLVVRLAEGVDQQQEGI